MKLFDIIEQFDINELFGYIKEDPFYILENMIVSGILFLIMYWFATARCYGAFFFFCWIFFLILKSNLGEKFNYSHFSVICVYFFYGSSLFVFWQNITGMIPETLTVTAFLILPAFLSFVSFIASFFIALEHTHFKLPRGFLPANVPVVVAPFPFVIESLSYFIRLFSLSIRLFINILAGHMLLKIFTIIIVILCGEIAGFFYLWFIIQGIEISFIFLEYVACALQAVALVSLIAIYIDHAMNLYHR